MGLGVAMTTNTWEEYPMSTQSDSLDKSMTNAAIQLIDGALGEQSRAYFIGLFKSEPLFIEDVAPEYREALRQVLGV
jgi:hypothetical protein